MTNHSRGINGFVPEFLILDIVSRAAKRGDMQTLLNFTGSIDLTAKLLAASPSRVSELHRFMESAAGPTAPRQISDAQNSQRLPGKRARFEDDAESKDPVVNKSYDIMGNIRKYFWEIHGRNSIDANGMPLRGVVHVGTRYANAYWDGVHMAAGDGDGVFMTSLADLNVFFHEMGHGVTEYAVKGGIDYYGMGGAINEALSDMAAAFGESWVYQLPASKYHWLIGKDIMVQPSAGSSAVRRALRDMQFPGTAYNDPRMGKDPQPDHMDRYVRTSSDNGGVHINSGIPNRFICLFARSIPGQTWEETMGVADRIVYAARPNLGNRPSFAQFAYWVSEACAIYKDREDELRKLVFAAAGLVGIVPSKIAGDDLTPTDPTDEVRSQLRKLEKALA